MASGAREQAWAVRRREDDEAIGRDGTGQVADGCLVKAPFGTKGAPARPTPPGAPPRIAGHPAPRAPLSDGRGIPVAVLITGANRPDGTQLAARRDAQVVDPAPGEPPHLALDRGDDDDACRAEALARGDPVPSPPKASAERPIPPPGHPDRHPPRRWVVEVGHAWCNRVRRVMTRWEKRGAHDLAFVHLAACLIIDRKIRHPRSLAG